MISTTMLWCCHHGRAIARVHPVHLMNNNNNKKRQFIRRRNMAWVTTRECRMAPSGRRPKTKPDDLGCESACTSCQKLHPPSPFIITHPESWYLFYRPSRPSWLVTYRDGLPVHSRSPIRVLTSEYFSASEATALRRYTNLIIIIIIIINRVWRSATTLIEANALPLSHTANT